MGQGTGKDACIIVQDLTLSLSHAIAVLFAVCVVLLMWLRIKREDNAVMSSILNQAFPRFVTIFVAGMAVLILIVSLSDSGYGSDKFLSVSFILLPLVFGIVFYLVIRRLPFKDRGKIQRQLWIMFLVFAGGVVLYGALVAGLHPVVAFVLILVGSITAIVVLHRSWWN